MELAGSRMSQNLQNLTSPLTLHLRIPNLRQRLNEQKRERGICKLLRCRIIFARTITSLFIKIEARIWIGGLFESLGDSHFFLRGKDLISEHRKLHRCWGGSQSAATAMIWPSASCDLACWKSSKGELWRGEEKGKKLADGRRHIRQCHSTAAFLPLIANCSPPNLSLHVFTLILGLCWKTKSGGKKRVFKNCAHFKNLSAFTASDYSLAFLPHSLHDFGLIHRTGVVTEMRSNLRPLRESSVHLQEKHIKCNCALTSKAAIDAIHCFV